MSVISCSLKRSVAGILQRQLGFLSVVDDRKSFVHTYENCKKQENGNGRTDGSSRENFKFVTGVCISLTAAGFGIIYFYEKRKVHLEAKKVLHPTAGQPKPDLPSYSLEEVLKHSSVKDRIWVTYDQGVYDITDYICQHPGGDKIMLAAGGSVEPFWMIYGVHKRREILNILEKYRIGNVSEEDAKVATSNMDDPYANEPKRHPVLRPSALKPFNAEPPPGLLVESFITPVDLFYVRNHLPVPEVDPATYELEVTGSGVKDATLKLDDIKKFPKYTVTAAIQCAGNRRSEMSQVKQVKGLDWQQSAIGNAEWSGTRLYDLLTSLGLKVDDVDVQHVQFEGLDTDPTNHPYGASIPIEKAMDPRGDVILAYEMNGQPLNRDHGFPIRVIVPGVVGARNVKWLARIVVSKDESDSHWQQSDYKGFSPSVDWHNVDFKTAPAIQELPVVSAFCEPNNNDTVVPEFGKIKVKGYAYSGGGRKIVRVDLTKDEGKTWQVADLVAQDAKNPPRHYGWTLWEAEVPVSKKDKKLTLWVKAVDSSYNTQPETFKNIWNLRGVLGNAYHRITINIKHS